jgi:mannose-6-phosphate isomerase-like protein (cupin superfamily)
MTATKASNSVIALDEAAREAAKDGRAFVRVRHQLGIDAFGVNATYQAAAGERLIGEHDEMNPGAGEHEELYVLVNGAAKFTVDGEDIDVPQGSAIAIAPESVRSAIATEDETLVVIVGNKRGAYEGGAGAAMGDFLELHRNKDYAGALAAVKGAFETHPGNPLVYYNIACMESLLGNADASLAALEESVTKWPKYKELAAGDDDFTALREDPRFQALIA